nr:MAG TPA: protein of unknown function (DUF4268) [Caudoviricetes sp.]
MLGVCLKSVSLQTRIGRCMKLSKLEKIDLRDQWKDEAKDFTPWLAKEENIALLSDAIGMELEVEGTEEKVGAFSADILCKDISTNKLVVIENQLEATDHSHLGQVITYCSGLQANTFIWIASQIREEHRAAVDWLNNVTDDEHNFFAIEVQLFKIDDSSPAPYFKIVAKPNGWSKSVKKQVSGELNETAKLKLEYWDAFREYVLEHHKDLPFKLQSAQPQHWMNVAIGTSAAHLSLIIGRKKSLVAVQLWLDSINAKANYDSLAKNEELSKTEISPNIDWDRMDEYKSSIITMEEDGDYHNRKD